jgi:hypothetical protein
VWRVGGSAAGIVVGLLTVTLLLHHLGVADSGRYVTVLSLLAIGSSVVDLGLNVSGSRELALCGREGRARLMANILGQRLWIAPIAVLAIVSFALLAGYTTRMVIGAVLAGTGLYAVAMGTRCALGLSARAGCLGAAEGPEQPRGTGVERGSHAARAEVSATALRGSATALRGTSDRGPARQGEEVATDIPSIGYLVPPDSPT